MIAHPTPNRPPLRRRLKLAVLLLVALGLASLAGNRGLVRLYRMHQTKATLEREIAHLAAHNAVLADEVRALRTDPARVEAIARAELGLVKPGELVYEFRVVPRPSRTPEAR